MRRQAALTRSRPHNRIGRCWRLSSPIVALPAWWGDIWNIRWIDNDYSV